jgi:hypothetical protein
VNTPDTLTTTDGATLVTTPDNTAATVALGEDLLADPTLLATIADNTNPAAVYEAVDAAWNAYLADETTERWHAFSNVLVAADNAGMTGENIVDFGRKWANKMPPNEDGLPSEAVVAMFAPHLKAAGLIL